MLNQTVRVVCLSYASNQRQFQHNPLLDFYVSIVWRLHQGSLSAPRVQYAELSTAQKSKET